MRYLSIVPTNPPTPIRMMSFTSIKYNRRIGFMTNGEGYQLFIKTAFFRAILENGSFAEFLSTIKISIF